MRTLQQLSEQHLIGYRTLERNLSKIKRTNPTKESLFHDGTRWLVDERLTSSICKRKYKRFVDDREELTTIIKSFKKFESKLTIFGTVAVKGVESIPMLNNFMHQLFGHLTATTDAPVKLLWGIENNTNYFDNNNGYHIHFVSDAPSDDLRTHQKELNEILLASLPKNQVNEYRSVKVEEYVMGLGIGGLNYTVKYFNDNPIYYGLLAK